MAQVLLREPPSPRKGLSFHGWASDSGIADDNGQTPLELATELGERGAVQILQEARESE